MVNIKESNNCNTKITSNKDWQPLKTYIDLIMLYKKADTDINNLYILIELGDSLVSKTAFTIKLEMDNIAANLKDNTKK